MASSMLSVKRQLLSVSYHYYTETGIIDFGIYTGILEQYLKQYGKQGADSIKNTLEFLKAKVDEYLEKVEGE